MGLELLEELPQTIQRPAQSVREREPDGGGRRVDDTDDGVTQMRLGLHLPDERGGEWGRAENQHSLQEGLPAHDDVEDRAERQKDREDGEEAPEEGLTRDLDRREHGVENCEQDEGDTKGMEESDRKFAERPDDPEVVEVVVVERDGATDGDGKRFRQSDRAVRPRGHEGCRPDQDRAADRGQQRDPLQHRELQDHE